MKKIISLILTVTLIISFVYNIGNISFAESGSAITVSDYIDTSRSLNFSETVWRNILDAKKISYDTDTGNIADENGTSYIQSWDLGKDYSKSVFYDKLNIYVQTGKENGSEWRTEQGITVGDTSLKALASRAVMHINSSTKVIKDMENNELNPDYPKTLSRYSFNGQSFIYNLKNMDKSFKPSKVVVKFVTVDSGANGISVGTNRSDEYLSGNLDTTEKQSGVLKLSVEKNNDFSSEQIKWKDSKGNIKWNNYNSYSATLTGFTTDDLYFGFLESDLNLYVYAVDVYTNSFSADLSVEGAENHIVNSGSDVKIKISVSSASVVESAEIFDGKNSVGFAQQNDNTYEYTFKAEHGLHTVRAVIHLVDGNTYETQKFSFKAIRQKNYSDIWTVEDYKDVARSTNFSDDLVRQFLDMWDVNQGQTIEYDENDNIITGLKNGYSWHAKEKVLSDLHIYTEKLTDTDSSYYYSIFVPYSQIKAKEDPGLNFGYDKNMSRKVFGFQRIKYDLMNGEHDSLVSKVKLKCVSNVSLSSMENYVCKTDTGRELNISAYYDPEYVDESGNPAGNPIRYFANEENKENGIYNLDSGWNTCIIEITGFNKSDEWFSLELPSNSGTYYTDIEVYHNTVTSEVSVSGAEGKNVISGTELEFNMKLKPAEYINSVKVFDNSVEIGLMSKISDGEYGFGLIPEKGTHEFVFEAETDFGTITSKPVSLNVIDEDELRNLYVFNDCFTSEYGKYFSDEEMTDDYDHIIADGFSKFSGIGMVYRELPSTVDFDENNDLWYTFDFKIKDINGFNGISFGNKIKFGINQKDSGLYPYLSICDQDGASSKYYSEYELYENNEYTAAARLDLYNNKISFMIFSKDGNPKNNFDIECSIISDGDIINALVIEYNTVDSGSFDIESLSSEIITVNKHFNINDALLSVNEKASFINLSTSQKEINSLNDGIAKKILLSYIDPIIEQNKNTPPIVEYVGINGTPETGKILTAEVKYTDLGFNFDTLKYVWRVGGTVISTDTIARADSKYDGESVVLTITPISLWGTEGKEVSESVKLNKNNTSVSVGGGSKSSGSGTGGVITPPSDNTNNVDVDESVSFSDISDHWAKSEISELFKKKIVNGRSKNLFEPDGNITRAEMAQLVYKAFNPTDRSGERYIVDVPNNAWYSKAVNSVMNARIMLGKDNGLFKPDDLLTREELAKILYTIYSLKYVSAEEAVNFCTDEQNISDWARPYVAKAYTVKIINGFDDGSFKPQSVTTRAEVAAAIYRLMEKLK